MRFPVSHSRLNSYEECPFKFKAIYRDKVPQVKSVPMLVGGLLHKVFDDYIQHLLSTKQQSDFAAAEELFNKLWEKRAGTEDWGLIPETMYDELLDIVVAFRENHLFDPAAVAGSEVEIALDQEWKVCDWMAPGVFFRMKIDLLEVQQTDGVRQVHITDFKTGYAVTGSEGTARDPQLRRYLMGVQAIMPADSFLVSLDFVRLGVVRKAELAPEVATAAKREVLAISNRIEKSIATGTWPATPGTGCAACPVFERCPARSLAVQFRAPVTKDEAVAALQRLILLDRESGDLKDALKSWATDNGAVAAAGMAYGPSVTRSKEYDTKEFIQWASRFGIDPNLALKPVDKAALTKLIKKTPRPKEATAMLEAIGKDRSFSVFRLRKADEE